MKKPFCIFPIFILLAFSCGKSPEELRQEQPLGVPSGIRTTELTNSSVSLVWDAVPRATMYYARLCDNVDKIISGGQKNVTDPAVSFTGLAGNSGYKLTVKAVNNSQESAYSQPFSFNTEPDPAPPEKQDDEGDDDGNDDSDDVDAAARYAGFLIPSAEEDKVARAFPGAEGGGMYTTGGRGGQVLHVTNLNDSGEGSLRWAVEQKGARTVVFDVSGIIELSKSLVINNGDITIAGQTAPGDGICIKNYTTNVNADNVIIRFIRFRLGDEGANAGDGEDSTWGRYHKNIILDHCSMSWSIDECASYYGNCNMTMQWCLITESLNNSLHSKGAHGYGGIWGGKDASFHHNILSNHHSRNPRIDHPEVYGGYVTSNRGNCDLRNNIIYNWGDNSCYGGEGGCFNIVNCYYKPGPNSKDRKFFVQATAIYSGKTDYGYPYLYLKGNIHTKYSDISQNNEQGIRWYDEDKSSKEGRVVAEPLRIYGPDGQAVYTTTHSAETALERTVKWSGASLRKDSVDERAVSQIKNDTGKIIDRQTDVGGWPSYNASEEELARVLDTDEDGIPDWWEDLMQLDKKSAADGNAVSIDTEGRYTNLEMYLHYLVRDIVAAQTEGGEYVTN